MLIVYTRVVAVDPPPGGFSDIKCTYFRSVINTRGVIGRGQHDIGGVGGLQLAEMMLLQQGHCRSPSPRVLWVARRVLILPDFKRRLAWPQPATCRVVATVLLDSCHNLLG